MVPVPDSGVAAAIGYSAESGLPYRQALIRNHYVGRTFIEPSQAIRDFGVKLKLNPVRHLLQGQRVVLVDDSIVRGTTSRKIVRMVRQAGAREVHLRISCPPTISPCFYGVDTPDKSELIASNQTVEEIRRFVEADSLGYLSLASLRKAVADERHEYCYACYTGDYPTDLVRYRRAWWPLGREAALMTCRCFRLGGQSTRPMLKSCARWPSERALRGDADARQHARPMERSRALVDRLAAGDAPIYAVNTGVGLLADVRIPREDLDRLQRNVIRSHSAGVGDPLRARSGARHDADSRQRAGQGVFRHPAAGGRAPVRPAQPRRHAGGAVAGQRGRVGRPGAAGPHGAGADRRRRSRTGRRPHARRRGAVARAGIEPIELHPKEGISLINGTQAMLAIGCLELEAARRARRIGRRDLRAHAGRPARHAARLRRAHPGRAPASRANCQRRAPRGGCSKAARSASRTSAAGRVQDAYSLRCAPQVHGAVRDALAEAAPGLRASS